METAVSVTVTEVPSTDLDSMTGVVDFVAELETSGVVIILLSGAGTFLVEGEAERLDSAAGVFREASGVLIFSIVAGPEVPMSMPAANFLTSTAGRSLLMGSICEPSTAKGSSFLFFVDLALSEIFLVSGEVDDFLLLEDSLPSAETKCAVSLISGVIVSDTLSLAIGDLIFESAGDWDKSLLLEDLLRLGDLDNFLLLVDLLRLGDLEECLLLGDFDLLGDLEDLLPLEE